MASASRVFARQDSMLSPWAKTWGISTHEPTKPP